MQFNIVKILNLNALSGLKILYEILFIALTLLFYLMGKLVYKKSKSMMLHTIIVSTCALILFFKLIGVEIEFYENNTKVLNYLLNLSVVALGYLLHIHFDLIRQKGVMILLATFFGSLASLISIAFISSCFGSSLDIIIAILPKSVTTPIAIIASERGGADPHLTAVVVTLSGIFGAVVGPWFLEKLKINDPLSRGLALGAAAHGIGTAKALEFGALEGAAGGLAIALMGFITSLLMPPIIALMQFFA